MLMRDASMNEICASGSGVEYNLAKVGVAGSNPVSRLGKHRILSGAFSVFRLNSQDICFNRKTLIENPIGRNGGRE